MRVLSQLTVIYAHTLHSTPICSTFMFFWAKEPLEGYSKSPFVQHLCC